MISEIRKMQRMQDRRMGGKQSVDDEIKLSIYDDFENNPAYQEVLINGDKKIGVHFVHKSRQFGDPEIYTITRPDDEIVIGDYVTDKNDDTWICYTRDKFTVYKNFLSLCNNKLRWESDGIIYEIPCMLSDKTSVYSDGMSRNKRFTLADDQILVTIPNNTITQNIRHGKKFIFNNNKNEIYTTHRIDTLPNPGLMDIKMRRARYDEFTDDLELGISNPAEPSEGIEQGIEIDGYGGIIKGTEEYYSVDYDKPIEFSIKESVKGITLTDNGDNTCTIYAETYVESFTLVATSLDNPDVYAELKISVSVW